MVNNDPGPTMFGPDVPLQHENATTIVTSEETSSSPATDVPPIEINLSDLTEAQCITEPAWIHMLHQIINAQKVQHGTIQSLSRAVTNLNKKHDKLENRTFDAITEAQKTHRAIINLERMFTESTSLSKHVTTAPVSISPLVGGPVCSSTIYKSPTTTAISSPAQTTSFPYRYSEFWNTRRR